MSSKKGAKRSTLNGRTTEAPAANIQKSFTAGEELLLRSCSQTIFAEQYHEPQTEKFVKSVRCLFADGTAGECRMDACLLEQSLLFTRQWDAHLMEMKRRLKKWSKRAESGGKKKPVVEEKKGRNEWEDEFVFQLPCAVVPSLVSDIVEWLQEHDGFTHYDFIFYNYQIL